jgi:hypothetical protein
LCSYARANNRGRTSHESREGHRCSQRCSQRSERPPKSYVGGFRHVSTVTDSSFDKRNMMGLKRLAISQSKTKRSWHCRQDGTVITPRTFWKAVPTLVGTRTQQRVFHRVMQGTEAKGEVGALRRCAAIFILHDRIETEKANMFLARV